MPLSKRKQKHISSNHELYKENNNYYGKHIECTYHNQSHILIPISYVSKFLDKHEKDEQKLFWLNKGV